jgi:Secretion system C-terminal sorting domain
MRNYSPSNQSEDFTPLGEFSQEVWTKADSMYPGFNFNDYNLFLIFHAGVGRDISLPGSVGDERDLPSVYLGLNSLQKIFGSDFDGFGVSNGSFKITNSLIIPETENREVSTITGQALFQITINGLLSSSVGSYLGLPDLYDTNTGLSAIGRFGLMDGQGIFAYNGIFPPEPSPWSKIFLGWASPVTVSLGPDTLNINLVTNLASTLSDTVILKVPLSSSEYFLIENRSRDANRDGSIVTYSLNGQSFTKTFYLDTTGYYSYAVDSVNGIVTNIDEPDWAVPGSGIVIWHIDDNVINAKIADDKINTDKNHRGVYVEEADGVQDIGEIFTTILGDEVVGEGTNEDLWYKTNPAELYHNIFSKDTKPNTNTNSGANSLITMSDFSDISDTMSFKLSFGDSLIVPLISKKINISGKVNYLTEISTDTSNYFALMSGNNLLLINDSGDPINSINKFSKQKPATVSYGIYNYIIGVYDSLLNIYKFDGANNDSIQIDVKANISTPPVVKLDTFAVPFSIFVGTSNGKVLQYASNILQNDSTLLSDSVTIDPLVSIKKIAIAKYYSSLYYALIAEPNYGTVPSSPINLFYDSDGNKFAFTSEQPVDLALTKDKNGVYTSIVLTNKNRFYVIKNGKQFASWQFNSVDSIKNFSLADIKRDGENYIIINNSGRLEARNFQGALAINFPYADPFDSSFTLLPVAADFAGDNNSEVLDYTSDGRIFAIDGGSSKIVNGFPLASGALLTSTPVLFNVNNKMAIASINKQNIFTIWEIGSSSGKIFWAEGNADHLNTSFVDAAEGKNIVNEFFPKSRAYNYPNPVYGSQTYLRYYVSEDSKIDIKIFDLAGDYVAHLSGNARGGFDNETIWDVSGIQSGIYLARIEAVSPSGKSESNIIKIAVVK